MTAETQTSHTTTTDRRTTQTLEVNLTPMEEKILRMRHGLAGTPELELEHMGQDVPEAAAILSDLERRAIESAEAQQNRTKEIIIDSLKQ